MIMPLRLLLIFSLIWAQIVTCVWAQNLSSDSIINRGILKLSKEQMEDGSFTAKVVTSSPAYSCQMILLYEYLGIAHEKKDLIQKLVPGILKYKNSIGSISSFIGGPHDQSVSLTCYLALKVAKVESEKIQDLKELIEKFGGVAAAGLTGAPFSMLFGLDERVYCTPKNGVAYMQRQGKRLPWVRVVLIPLYFLFENNLIHEIDHGLKIIKGCKAEPIPKNLREEEAFLTWAKQNLSPNMTLFDYTPTTIPTLMALSKTKIERSVIEKSVQALEKFYYLDKEGDLMASPGEASVSETGVAAKSFLDLGMDPRSPVIQKSLKFILSTQNKENGSFGFSKSNVHFPDPNDTATTLQFFHSYNLKTHTNELNESIVKGLKWILSRQNKDGGFGAWDKDAELNKLFYFAYKRLQQSGVVLGDSIGDDTARIIMALHEMASYDSAVSKSVDRAVKWLGKEQAKNGSFYGRWFINYGFGTASSLAALATRSSDPKVKKKILKGLVFLSNIQRADGGFGESPLTYYRGHYVSLPYSSSAQTGFILYNLGKIVQFAPELKNAVEPIIKRGVKFLKGELRDDGQFHDKTWTAVSMGNIEFLVYPYLQELLPLMALAEAENTHE